MEVLTVIILVKDDAKLQEDSLTAEVGQHIYTKDGRDYYFICSLSDCIVLRTSHSQHSEQMTSLPEEIVETFQKLAFLYSDGLKIEEELEDVFGGAYTYYNHSMNEFFFTQNCIDYSAEAVFEPWNVVLSMSKYCEEVEGAIYMDEQGVVHDLSVEDVVVLGIYQMNNSVKRVKPNPFGRIGLVAMAKKEHNSIGDWALQQKRRRQLNELLEEFRKRAPLGMPNPATGRYDDKLRLINSGFFKPNDWSEVKN